MNIHHHYDQLTERERKAVDDAIGFARNSLLVDRVPIANDDRIERAVDALARAVIESRPK